MANSFGTYLARALVDRVPDHIGAITICSGVFDLRTAVLRLGWQVAQSHGDLGLQTSCRETADANTAQSYFGLFARVSAMPGFLECCWNPSVKEPREARKALAATGRLIDWPTCQAVMTAALATPQVALPGPRHEQVRILLGRFDPYFDDSDIAVWRTLWSGAIDDVVNAGQFPHLELPVSVWFPGRSD